jgi:tetratricopeptide (TPR) repeat protein
VSDPTRPPTVSYHPEAAGSTGAPANAADDGPRYRIDGELGRGGMAVVHAAFDHRLGRRVALKVVRPDRVDTVSRTRLLAEARALARLRHPNIVTIHDVGILDGQIYLAMELIEGGSLARWLGGAPRPWPEIVERFVGAGRGLAAAHAAGMIHRDFKPDNVLLELDGTPRVADFGLAVSMPSDEPSDAPLSSSSESSPPRGTIAGTLGFIAPEQLAGAPATAASDQFAYCVSLYQALYRRRPFAGSEPDTLRRAIERGVEPARPGDPGPTWLRALIVRGLAPRPADRHPSMAALVAELARPRGWRRWRGPVVLATTAAVTITAVALATMRDGPGDPTARCDGGLVELDTAWGPAARATVREVFARIATPMAEVAGARVVAALDEQARRWSAMHRSACVDHARGVQSAEILDRRMRCLRERRDGLAAAAAVLARTDATTAGVAVDVAARLSPIEDCADLEFLASELPPPPAVTDRVHAQVVRGRLATVEALDRAGRSSEALTALAALVAEARALGDPGTLLATLLVQGRILLFQTQYAEAIVVLQEAETLALRHGAVAAAVEAGARRLFAQGISSGANPGALLAVGATLEALSETLPPTRLARPLLLNNLGVVAMSRGAPAEARVYFERAAAMIAEAPAIDLELTVIERNLTLVEPDPARRERLARAQWQRLRDRLGDAHAQTLEALVALAHQIADDATALELLDQAWKLSERFHPEALILRASIVLYAGFLAEELKQPERARTFYEQMIAMPPHPETRNELTLARGFLALLGRDAAAARRAFAEVPRSADPTWWARYPRALADLGLARLELTEGRPQIARPLLERARAVFLEAAAITTDRQFARRAAQADALLESLGPSPRSRRR